MHSPADDASVILSPRRDSGARTPILQKLIDQRDRSPTSRRSNSDHDTYRPSKILKTSAASNQPSVTPKSESRSPEPSTLPLSVSRLPPDLRRPSQSMPHRLESSSFNSRLSDGEGHLVQGHPSPPPQIATLSQSPSLSSSSLDRSSVSSPAPTGRGSALSMQAPSPYMNDMRYTGTANSVDRSPRTYYQAPPNGLPPPQEHMYREHPVDSRYSQSGPGHHRSAMYPPPAHVVPSQISAGAPHPPRELNYPFPGQPQYNTIYTDDATRKLSDGVRRRCFNCCTTDTSTWRRSSLNLGKVLCNKCGLFERTHARPRPAQFPHKRGPLATSSLRARASPTAVSQLPAMPTHAAPPSHQYGHPSIAPLRSRTEHGQRADTLPQIHSWIDAPSSAPAPPTARSPGTDQQRYPSAVSYRPQSP